MANLITRSIASLAAAALTGAAPASRPAVAAKYSVRVSRTVGDRTVESIEMSVNANSPAATVATAGGTRLTVDRVIPTGGGGCQLRVRYGEDDVDPRTGTINRHLVSTTLEPSLGRPYGLGESGRAGRLAVVVSAVHTDGPR